MSLIMHCGAKPITLRDLQFDPTPPRTRSHVPVPHWDFANRIRGKVPSGYKIRNEAYGVQGTRFFGVLYIDRDDAPNDDYNFVIGMRGCNGKTMKRSIAFGSHVFVCDNMCFSGTTVVHRKHTAGILRDLDGIIDGVMNQARTAGHDLDKQIAYFKDREMSPSEIHDLSVLCMDEGVLTPRTLKKTLEGYRRPKHDAFLPRTMWSYLNAVTESLKPTKQQLDKGRGNFDLHTERTTKLHDLCQSYRVFDYSRN